MRKVLAPIVVAATLVGAAACSSSTDNALQTADETAISQDVAASAGDAAATTVNDALANDQTAGLASFVSPQGLNYSVFRPSLTETVSRTKTCYDANHVVVAGCAPLNSVRTVITLITHDRSRSGTSVVTGGATVSWSGSFNRTAYDSLTRVFTGSTETSRVHNNIGTEHDTTTFSNGTVSRAETEVAHDSVAGLTFAVPRTANEQPSAGTITRIDSVHVVITDNGNSRTRDVVRLVTITFPADANGNVTITVTGDVNKTCTYNIGTSGSVGTGKTTCQ